MTLRASHIYLCCQCCGAITAQDIMNKWCTNMTWTSLRMILTKKQQIIHKWLLLKRFCFSTQCVTSFSIALRVTLCLMSCLLAKAFNLVTEFRGVPKLVDVPEFGLKAGAGCSQTTRKTNCGKVNTQHTHIQTSNVVLYSAYLLRGARLICQQGFFFRTKV